MWIMPFAILGILLVCTLIVWALIEALWYDHNRTKFLNELTVGDAAKLHDELVYIMSIDDNDYVVVYNLHNEPVRIDKSLLQSPTPIVSAIKTLYRKFREEA
jgi:predicted outer membrane lipoprotein